MKPLNILLGIAFLLTATGLSLYFDPILNIFASSFKLGWVFSSIFIRVLVTLLFIFSLREFFAAFLKKNMKFWVVTLIGIVPGFFLSFISVPIYSLDYGLINDDLKLGHQTELAALTNGGFQTTADSHRIVAFFTSNCPFCKMACRKLDLNKTAGQKVPVQLIFPGSKEDTDRFLTENNGTGFEHFRIDDNETFINASGGRFPSIFLLDENGETVFHWTGDEMNYSALDYLNQLEQ